jgi:phosphoribosylformylglycinamidine synthase
MPRYPDGVTEVPLLSAGSRELQRISRELGLNLNLQEMKACKHHFSKLGRNPTDVEMQSIAQTWSEHCFHKTFKGEVEVGGKRFRLFRDFIEKATKELNPRWCFSVFEDNAGLIDFEGDYLLAAKVETHNHPSAVEPFGGAATGVGGVIRDILGVWGKPIACIDVLGFGPLDYSGPLPPGLKHPRYIFRGVVAGIGHYGNNMGIPTVAGAIWFDESYIGNPVVYCGCVGLVPRSRYVRRAKPGDLLVLAGGRTGLDGIHGVTFASAELTEESEEEFRSAVQIPDPIEEERLRRAILDIRDQALASAITDLGGGGLSCAVGETARRFGCGARVRLNRVPLKYPKMLPWQIWISESQERMLLCVPQQNSRRVMEIFSREEVEAVVIGELERGDLLRVQWRGQEIARLDLNFLFSPPVVKRRAVPKRSRLEEPSFPEPDDLGGILLRLLSSPNICSREGVVRTYDHEVQGNTVLKPLHGKWAGPSDAAVLKPLEDSRKGVVISCGFNPRYGKIDSYWMAALCIEEALRNNVAVGGRRIALLDNFTWGNPEKPDQLWNLLRCCEGCYKFARELGAPFISGKDSLYNESPLGPVTPTLLITGIGIMEDISQTVSLDLKREGDPVYLLGMTYQELGGSEYYALRGELGRSIPKVRIKEAKRILGLVQEAIGRGYVRACHDLSEGGLGVAAAEIVMSGDLGMELELQSVPTDLIRREDFILFSESASRFLLEVRREEEKNFRELVGGAGARVGEVIPEPVLRIYGLEEEVCKLEAEDLRRAWRREL